MPSEPLRKIHCRLCSLIRMGRRRNTTLRTCSALPCPGTVNHHASFASKWCVIVRACECWLAYSRCMRMLCPQPPRLCRASSSSPTQHDTKHYHQCAVARLDSVITSSHRSDIFMSWQCRSCLVPAPDEHVVACSTRMLSDHQSR